MEIQEKEDQHHAEIILENSAPNVIHMIIPEMDMNGKTVEVVEEVEAGTGREMEVESETMIEKVVLEKAEVEVATDNTKEIDMKETDMKDKKLKISI